MTRLSHGYETASFRPRWKIWFVFLHTQPGNSVEHCRVTNCGGWEVGIETHAIAASICGPPVAGGRSCVRCRPAVGHPAHSTRLLMRRVSVLAADLGSMATIELTWPGAFRFQAASDSRILVLDFAAPFNAPDIAALRQRLGGWLSNIDKRADCGLLHAKMSIFVCCGANGTLRSN